MVEEAAAAAAGAASVAETADVSRQTEEPAPSTRQRKKRKWDQPAEFLPAAMTLPTVLPFNAVTGLASVGFPGMFAPAGVLPTLPLTPALSSAGQVPVLAALQQQNAAAIVQKINQDLKGIIAQPKIQDELIAREIVINDADPGIRYKLTKRQTQEEIQSKTGAVVITRGRYKPPNGPVDNEKPLYLHISAGVHLKDTAERIKAVDQAAAIVEEMLKQGRESLSGTTTGPLPYGGTSLLTSMVYVGCDSDPSFDLLGRIRGPNDQYLNHIMKETGTVVILRGRGSGIAEESTLPLHLHISCDNANNLDDARRLAENLLETVRSEYAVYRSSPFQVPLGPPVISQMAVPSTVPGSLGISLSPQAVNAGVAEIIMPSYSQLVPLNRVYAAVPPPKQLLADSSPTSETARSGTVEIQGTVCASTSEPTSESLSASTALPKMGGLLSEPASSLTPSPFPNHSDAIGVSSHSSNSNQVCPHGQLSGYGQTFPSPVSQIIHSYAQAASATTTSYSGYSGIYPQVSPLQQVAMALQRPPPPLSVKAAGTGSSRVSSVKPSTSNHAKQQEKQPGQRRKFQEFPTFKEPSKDDQVRKVLGKTQAEESWFPNTTQESRSPTLPMTLSTANQSSVSVHKKTTAMRHLEKQDTANGAGIKLVDYAEEDDETSEFGLPSTSPPSSYVNGKPFWAP